MGKVLREVVTFPEKGLWSEEIGGGIGKSKGDLGEEKNHDCGRRKFQKRRGRQKGGNSKRSHLEPKGRNKKKNKKKKVKKSVEGDEDAQ